MSLCLLQSQGIRFIDSPILYEAYWLLLRSETFYNSVCPYETMSVTKSEYYIYWFYDPLWALSILARIGRSSKFQSVHIKLCMSQSQGIRFVDSMILYESYRLLFLSILSPSLYVSLLLSLCLSPSLFLSLYLSLCLSLSHSLSLPLSLSHTANTFKLLKR